MDVNHIKCKLHYGLTSNGSRGCKSPMLLILKFNGTSSHHYIRIFLFFLFFCQSSGRSAINLPCKSGYIIICKNGMGKLTKAREMKLSFKPLVLKLSFQRTLLTRCAYSKLIICRYTCHLI